MAEEEDSGLYSSVVNGASALLNQAAHYIKNPVHLPLDIAHTYNDAKSGKLESFAREIINTDRPRYDQGLGAKIASLAPHSRRHYAPTSKYIRDRLPAGYSHPVYQNKSYLSNLTRNSGYDMSHHQPAQRQDAASAIAGPGGGIAGRVVSGISNRAIGFITGRHGGGNPYAYHAQRALHRRGRRRRL
jgi:hypothetical protein